MLVTILGKYTTTTIYTCRAMVQMVFIVGKIQHGQFHFDVLHSKKWDGMSDKLPNHAHKYKSRWIFV